MFKSDAEKLKNALDVIAESYDLLQQVREIKTGEALPEKLRTLYEKSPYKGAIELATIVYGKFIKDGIDQDTAGYLTTSLCDKLQAYIEKRNTIKSELSKKINYEELGRTLKQLLTESNQKVVDATSFINELVDMSDAQADSEFLADLKRLNERLKVEKEREESEKKVKGVTT